MRARTLTAVIVGLVPWGSSVCADYVDEVLSDEPFAYWRLGDEDVFSGAFNSAEVDPLNAFLLDGIYAGDALLEEPGLIAGDPDPAVGFNGIDAAVQIPDSDLTNVGGPFVAKTVELWFQADLIDAEPRVLFEEGGTTRGLTLYVHDAGTPSLFMGAWNLAEEQWGVTFVSTEIEEGVSYHAVMVYDASENDTFGDFDGRVTGYLNGEEFGTEVGADDLHGHSNDTAIGAVSGGETKIADGTNKTAGGFFSGIIDEVALYDYPLDDPDDDGDFGDSRVLDHFLVGFQPPVAGCPEELTATADGSNVRLAWTKGTETSVRVVRNGTEIAAAASVDPPQYVDMNPPPGRLDYELQFTLPGEDCSLTRRIDTCVSDLTATSAGGGIELQWQNNFGYSGLVVMRGDEVLATIGGDQVSYTDSDPPAGLHTYSVIPEGSECDPAATVEIRVFESAYATMVVADGATGYWRMDDEDDFALLAANVGSVGVPLDGTYVGGVLLESDSLLPAVPENPAVLFDGLSAALTIPNHDTINVGGPFRAATIEFWFRADVIDIEPRVIYEQGGATRGLSIYVQEIAGDPLLFMCGWNLAQEQWGVISVSAEIEPEVPYHAALVFDATENDVFGDFDGRITGYLNGEEFETQLGVDDLHQHTGAIGIGAPNGATLLEDGSQPGFGYFAGVIDEFATYTIALDDPNGDKDLDDSRVMDHYLAGSEGGDGEDVATLKPGDVNGDGGLNITDMVTQLNFLFGGADLPECYIVAGADPAELNATGLIVLDYNGDGASNIADAVAGLAGLFGGGGPHVLGEGCAEIEGTCESNCAP